MTIPIYVAGKWTDKESIKNKMRDLELMGCKITYNWTLAEEQDFSHQQLESDAVKDINGIKQAKLLIVIMDDEKYSYRGTFCEIGCALGLDKQILVYCPRPEESEAQRICFVHHPLICQFPIWLDLLRYVGTIRG